MFAPSLRTALGGALGAVLGASLGTGLAKVLSETHILAGMVDYAVLFAAFGLGIGGLRRKRAMLAGLKWGLLPGLLAGLIRSPASNALLYPIVQALWFPLQLLSLAFQGIAAGRVASVARDERPWRAGLAGGTAFAAAQVLNTFLRSPSPFDPILDAAWMALPGGAAAFVAATVAGQSPVEAPSRQRKTKPLRRGPLTTIEKGVLIAVLVIALSYAYPFAAWWSPVTPLLTVPAFLIAFVPAAIAAWLVLAVFGPRRRHIATVRLGLAGSSCLGLFLVLLPSFRALLSMRDPISSGAALPLLLYFTWLVGSYIWILGAVARGWAARRIGPHEAQ